MCRTTVGQVIAVEDGEAVVELEGLRRRAISLMVPDLRPGEFVLVGLGTVLGRVDPADRAALDDITQKAEPQPATPPNQPTS